MQMADMGPLGPDFYYRLRRALDRVQPPTPLAANARYRTATIRTSSQPRRFMMALALGAIAALVAAAGTIAAGGSPNPVSVTQRFVTPILPVSHVPLQSPSPDAKPSIQTTSGNPQAVASAAPHATPTAGSDASGQKSSQGEDGSHESSDHSGGDHHPSPWPSPNPSDDPNGSPRPNGHPSPNPQPPDQHGHDPHGH
jgi:hypothetical protein